jgi:hypothetical protein
METYVETFDLIDPEAGEPYRPDTLPELETTDEG